MSELDAQTPCQTVPLRYPLEVNGLAKFRETATERDLSKCGLDEQFNSLKLSAA